MKYLILKLLLVIYHNKHNFIIVKTNISIFIFINNSYLILLNN